MRDLIIIAAVSENNVIGRNNGLPWEISEDLQHFKELTINHPIIMGKNTYYSIGRPLPKRDNIVMSKSMETKEGLYIARDMQEALDIAGNVDTYIIGGSQIYELFLPLVRKMELTRVHKDFEGDAYFPDVNWKNWKLTKEIDRITKKGLKYSFQTFERNI
ncbi:MAG: dihydrofolate reductase [Nanoarchaeota archaeon]|nr:dihydrofolate reductase [Nanoarchaeota archaeon]